MPSVVAAILATALAAAIVLVQPWAGRRRYQRLVATIATEPEARIRHFRRGIVGEWAASALVLMIGVLASRAPASIGLDWGAHPRSEGVLVAEVAVLLGLSALVFRFGGPGIRNALRRQARGFAVLLPTGHRERWAFAALAVTAGICEELLFRGFGIAYVRWLWPSAPRLALVAIISAAFGLAHLYQGARGIFLTGLVGAYLAWLVLTTGSLLPAMAIHALLDLRILALPDLTQPAAAGPPAPVATAPRVG